MPIHVLDDPETYHRHDARGMLRHLQDFPASCRDAWQLAEGFTLPSDYRTVNKIVVLGMGGSAIGADLAAGLAECQVPIIIHRGYALPSFIDADTLVVASSYSGTTEETEAAFTKALAGPSKKLVMTTGGSLGELAVRHHLPCFRFSYASPPRAALPYSLMPFLSILSQLGFISLPKDTLDEAAAVLAALNDTIGEGSAYERNPAKKLAQTLQGKVGVVYGSEFLAEVGHRWKLQINENAKAWAAYEALPELNHNTVVGYRFPRDARDKVLVVILASELLDERILQRYLITQKLLREASLAYEVVAARGHGKLSQMLELIMFGDYVSYYLALLNQTDPYPLDEVDYLKSELSSYVKK
ncbi:MAG: bifunctional phosphoglucose/phosphomannose isomerase [Dehalococcoidia bacterium]|nr:bifunctional phosphoglucose/phosphomannose isomerase [Dehalococcoidia bacterium]